MPFDEEEQDTEPSAQSQKVGLKNVSSQKSIFADMPKKVSQEDFENKVKKVQEKKSRYKTKTADLAVQFYKTMSDKHLSQNKNAFQKELENELLKNMVRLAQEINSDGEEREGEGSLSWITLLLKTCFNQRDKINELEYSILQLDKKTDPERLIELINVTLDGKKNSE